MVLRAGLPGWVLAFVVVCLFASCAHRAPAEEEAATLEVVDVGALVESTETEDLLDAARTALQEGDPVVGGALLRAYSDRRDDEDAALRAYRIAEEFEDRALAIEVLEAAWEAHRSSTVADHLGELYWRSGYLREVGDLFDELVDLHEDDEEVLRFAVRFTSRRFLLESAARLVMRGHAADDPLRYLSQAQVREQLGDVSGARESLETFLSETEDLLPELELSVLIHLERWEEAEAVVRAILDRPDQRYLLEWQRYRPGGRFDSTTAEYPQPHLVLLGKILEEQGRVEEISGLFEGVESMGYTFQLANGHSRSNDVADVHRMLRWDGKYEVALRGAIGTGESSMFVWRPLLAHLYEEGRQEELEERVAALFDETTDAETLRRWVTGADWSPETGLAIILRMYRQTGSQALFPELARRLYVESPYVMEAMQLLREEASAEERIALASQIASRTAPALMLLQGLEEEDHEDLRSVLNQIYLRSPHRGARGRASLALPESSLTPGEREEPADLSAVADLRVATRGSRGPLRSSGRRVVAKFAVDLNLS